MYRVLIRNQWRTYFRSLRARQNLFVWFLMGFMGLYFAFILVTVGLYFNVFAAQVLPGQAPVAIVNTHLLAAFVGLFGIRFLFQKTSALKIQPYLHLPIPQSQLTRFFQATSLLSLHNAFPFLFFVPFWSRFILGHYPLGGAAAWMAGLVLLIVASNFANLLIRSLLTHYEARFFLLMGVMVILLGLDELTGAYVVRTFSTYLFGALLQDDAAVLLLLLALPAWFMIASNGLLLQRLRAPVIAPTRERRLVQHFPLLEKRGLIGQLLLLESKLMWRNRRPRHYLLMSVLFSTVYLVFMMANRKAFDGLLFGAVIGLFASGSFALNYGQLMFSWESSYFDGLMTRAVTTVKLCAAKLLFLQFSCVLFFLVTLPLFLWLRPELLTVHVAFLFYNAGITSALVLLLALRNRQPVDIGKSGGFFNYEGFSAAHWLWFFPTAIPPMLLLFALRNVSGGGLLVVGGLGLAGLLLSPVWISYFARTLLRRKHSMTQGFRRYDA